MPKQVFSQEAGAQPNKERIQEPSSAARRDEFSAQKGDTVRLDEAVSMLLPTISATWETLPAFARHGVLPWMPQQSTLYARRGDEDSVALNQCGWVQLPVADGSGIRLGLFRPRRQFLQLAVADQRGRVFRGTGPAELVRRVEPVLSFIRPQEERDEENAGPSVACAGSVVCDDDFGKTLRLSSWTRSGGLYDLHGFRQNLTDDLSRNLDFRDAVTVAFFALYLFPKLQRQLQGYGASNVFHHLRSEAPLAAVRHAVADEQAASRDRLRVSGIERYFSHLISESGALKTSPDLEARHGQEPLNLSSSPYSGLLAIQSHNDLGLRPMLSALSLEAALNRFCNAMSVIRRASGFSNDWKEETLSQESVARLDETLLTDPAIAALPLEPFPIAALDRADGREVAHFLDYARREANTVARGSVGAVPVERSEWVYRQTLSRLMRRLRLPFRIDMEFRSNLANSAVALSILETGRALMPRTHWKNGQFEALSDDERDAASADYQLRVGIILAALAFGANDTVREVKVQIDAIGLEEAVQRQDSATSRLVSKAFAAFGAALRGAKPSPHSAEGEPKDGDVHGDPTASTSIPPVASSGRESGGSGDRGTSQESADGKGWGSVSSFEDAHSALSDELKRHFEGVMRGFDFSFDSGDADGDAGCAASVNGTNDTAASATSSSADSNAVVSDAVDSSDADWGSAGADAMTVSNSAEGGASVVRTVLVPSDALPAVNPRVRRVVTVAFTRAKFVRLLRERGLVNPRSFYAEFDARMTVPYGRGFEPVDADSGLHDSTFAPVGSQEEPEMADRGFRPAVAEAFGTVDSLGLSIQREDVLTSVSEFFEDVSRRRMNGELSSVEAAKRVAEEANRIGDPEVRDAAMMVARAVIDGEPIPTLTFSCGRQLDKARSSARELLFSSNLQGAVAIIEKEIERQDAIFAGSMQIVPRYFNSYAERVVYNKLFLSPGETTLLIPDGLFYAHMEMGMLLSQLGDPQGGIEHLNKAVSYAPAYPLAHLQQSIQLAGVEDWESARAACLNALRVALDRDDAAFAYYRYAYAEWMRGRFDVAVAAYRVSDAIHPDGIRALRGECAELQRRARSQRVAVPQDVEEAKACLREVGVPLWPNTDVAGIVRRAARVAVDEGLFVPARTLAVAAARMEAGGEDGIDAVQAQFLRSLNA
ncbi:MAG: tetratricopeptide repeat protein [Bifidobacteriaceae bacterium]|nr:tetratricopeptide repeat protein [Bifidobacteriaceae bacterium]